MTNPTGWLGRDECGIKKKEGALEKAQESETLKQILMSSDELILRGVSERHGTGGDAGGFM